MRKGSIYARVYREEGISCVGRVAIKATFKKLRMVRVGYLAGINASVLERQVGLTEREIEYFVNNYRQEMKRVYKLRERCLKDSEVADKDIVKELYKNEIEIVRRLFDGEGMGSITKELGVPSREKVNRTFKKEMRKKGYIIHDIQKHHNIAEDVSLGATIEDMLDKYRMFVNERDVLRYLDLHQLLYQ